MRLFKNFKAISRMLIFAMLPLVWSFLFLNSCAFDIRHVKQVPTEIEPAPTEKSSFEIINEVNFILDSNYSRKLRVGTKWNYVFTIMQGDVFKTKDQILTVEASNIFEAYIVVSSNQLVGFYLPVEKTFSPLEDIQRLEMRGIN